MSQSNTESKGQLSSTQADGNLHAAEFMQGQALTAGGREGQESHFHDIVFIRF